LRRRPNNASTCTGIRNGSYNHLIPQPPKVTCNKKKYNNPRFQQTVVGEGASVQSLFQVLPGKGRKYNQCAPNTMPEKDME